MSDLTLPKGPTQPASGLTAIVRHARYVLRENVVTGFAFAMFVVIFSVVGEPGDLLFPVLMSGVGLVVGAFQQRVLRRVLGDARGWAVATGVGLGVGIALALAMGEGTGLGGKILEGTVHGAAIGAILGTLQFFVLRARVQGARRWVPASIVGWAAGAAAGDVVGYFVEGLDIVVGPVVAAAITGIALVVVLPSRVASGSSHGVLEPMAESARAETPGRAP